jgi:hypothetical protein
VINAFLAANAKVRVRVHELSHARFAATIDEVARRIEQANDSPTIVATEPQARVHAG